MSDWYNEPENREEDSYVPPAPPEPPVPPAPPVPPVVTMEEMLSEYNTAPAPVEEPAPYTPPEVPTYTPYVPPETPVGYTSYTPPEAPPAPVEEPAPYIPPEVPSAPSYYTPPAPSPVAPSYYTPPVSPQPPQPPQPPKKKNNAAVVVLAVVCAVSLLVTGILGVMLITSDDGNARVENEVTAPSDKQPEEGVEVNEDGPSLEISDSAEVDDGGLTTSEIVARNLDATVVLSMYQYASDSVYEFYGYQFGGSEELVQVSEASGIIMSEDGYIITNSHCVFDEESQIEYARIDVTLYDGRVYENATIVGYDPTTDLAVIKIDEKDLSVAQFGDSSALTLGDRVVTLGNSGGLQWSVSQGVLSGQARDVYEDTGYAIKCLQVDAVINPGSSGGPLINAYGQVVGVNSAKIVLTGYEGLGFSIPINEAKVVIDDLVKYGYVTGRVALGITGRTITSIGYEGFMVESINTDSAFVGTQVREGDIITHINGTRVMDYAEMRTELTKYGVGDTIELTLIRISRQTREVQEFTVEVVLQESR